MYIRTKDGVYKVSHYNDWATHKRKEATLIDGDKTSYIKNENIIAQSENLEELCDCFVLKTTFIESGNSYYGLYYYSDIKHFKVKEGYKGVWYGAIWTDKGLIYVAKMNENGELELIWKID